ncbi:MAG TPA: c-type cytochrome [Sphingobacteriaceae bacterium]
MKKFKKILIFFLLAVVIVICGALSYVKFALPNVGEAPELKVDITPQRVERGKYLANNVAVCIDCHSTRDWSKFSGPVVPEKLGAGGEKFDKSMGFPGEVHVPNITPHNLQTWTDGELFRAITTGVKKDGSAIFPIMPYKSYGQMDKEDILSIIAYLRTLPAKASATPERQLDFPLNFIVNTMPSEAKLSTKPAENDAIAHGKYLVNVAACGECHTKSDQDGPVAGFEFAGGNTFPLPNGTVTSANISPDKTTGIGQWTKEMFVAKFQAHANADQIAKVGAKEFQTIMPWTMYGKMKQTDLEAIYAYLQTVKPVKNKIVRFQPNN